MNRQLIRSLFAFAVAVMAGGCGGEGNRSPQRHVIEIRSFEYIPAEMSVAVGDTVVWINRDAVPHTATASDGGWDSESLGTDGSWTLVAVAGEGGEYSCTFHPNMVGRLEVR